MWGLTPNSHILLTWYHSLCLLPSYYEEMAPYKLVCECSLWVFLVGEYTRRTKGAPDCGQLPKQHDHIWEAADRLKIQASLDQSDCCSAYQCKLRESIMNNCRLCMCVQVLCQNGAISYTVIVCVLEIAKESWDDSCMFWIATVPKILVIWLIRSLLTLPTVLWKHTCCPSNTNYVLTAHKNSCYVKPIQQASVQER